MLHIPLSLLSHRLRKSVCITQLIASLHFPGRPRIQVPPQELGSSPKAMLALSWKTDNCMQRKRDLFLFGSLREMGSRGAGMTPYDSS